VTGTGVNPVARLDLRAHACPLTWVKARIALGRLPDGEVLEVVLMDGEPRENVPRSAEEDGHEVLSVEPAPEFGAGVWRARLRRRAPREETPWP
jgi:tRNA 2-thiouridine synthesizing protein A